jgi:hypothetical protein
VSSIKRTNYRIGLAARQRRMVEKAESKKLTSAKPESNKVKSEVKRVKKPEAASGAGKVINTYQRLLAKIDADRQFITQERGSAPSNLRPPIPPTGAKS